MSLFDQLKSATSTIASSVMEPEVVEEKPVVMEPEVVEEKPVVKAKKSNYEYQKRMKARTKEAYLKVARFAFSQDPSYVPEDVKEAATYLLRNDK